MNTLICGSMAYDNIMVFQGRFKEHILPEKIHILNVAFLVPEMRREFGGCAGNIAYNLKLLGGNPLIMATVGDDFSTYGLHLERHHISQAFIRHVSGNYTGQAFITTDLDDNQITAFHPGAMSFSEHNHVVHARNISLGIVSPDGRAGMLLHADEFYQTGIPWIFDPGQAMPMFNGEELLQFINKANYLTLNDYEAQMLQDKTGKTLEQLAQMVSALIVTRGGEGSIIYAQGAQTDIPAAKVSHIADPTGCGDAYRAGLLYGLENGWDWETTGRLASLMGAIKITSRGGQNHVVSTQEISDRFQQEFGYQINLP